ncbi:MAG TPA: hypothetical protein VMV19_11870 [Xanthobacteraceae bacterium]|nr:hypothetical protein [Xanthobacteraceae bacterium]
MADSEESKSNEPKLPMVISPRLDGSDEDAASSFPGEDAAHTASAASAGSDHPLSRSLRFALLAVSVAAAAAIGSFVGALSASGVIHSWSASADKSPAVMASARQTNKVELAELAALKSNLDGATRGASGQFARLAERLDRAERTQIEAATKVTHIADAVDRLEKKIVVAAAAASAAPETTGSIAASPPGAAGEAKLAEKILPDWIVQDVRRGHALVENNRGGVFDVAVGGILPGLGRIETIKRQGGQWVVVTAGGLITEHNN